MESMIFLDTHAAICSNSGQLELFRERSLNLINENQAIHLDFARDPFDRIIVADASINNSYLISKDKIIKKHYKNTVW
jgi:PIN domain nuclease of toxin-antitoxin system